MIKIGDKTSRPLINGKKILKRYIGEKKIYESVNLINFTSCPFPVSWTPITEGLNYKGLNKYGEWKISSNSYFQNSDNTLFDKRSF